MTDLATQLVGFHRTRRVEAAIARRCRYLLRQGHAVPHSALIAHIARRFPELGADEVRDAVHRVTQDLYGIGGSARRFRS